MGPNAAVTINWWDYWGTVSDLIVAAAAIAGLIFGLIQLLRIADANRNQVDIARAELLLEIDARYEAPEMRASRLAIRSLRNYCDDRARMDRPGASDIDVAARSDILMSEELTGLYQRFKTADQSLDLKSPMVDQPDDKDGNRYFAFMGVPYWAETVGLLTRADLLTLEDVLNLYDAVFVKFLTGFLKHIEDRRSEGPIRNEHFLENALWLRERAVDRQRMDKMELQARRAPKRGRLGR